MDPAIATALEPAVPGWLVRQTLFLPGVARTATQIEQFADHWRGLGIEAMSADAPVLVALGDSLAQGIGASHPDAGYIGRLRGLMAGGGFLPPVLNLSRSGARINDVIETQLPALQAAGVSTNLVTCTVGNNDLLRSARVGTARRALTELLERLPPEAAIATLPARGSMAAKGLNRHLRREAERLSIPLADVDAGLTSWRGLRADDRFHPNDAGYRIWADAFRPHLPAAQPRNRR